MTHETVVFDLDGTLVRLDVDWEAVALEVAETLRERGVTPPDSLWGMLETADDHGLRDDVESVISRHEQAGARTSGRLPAADTVPDGPVGVCSLNCEAACRIALAEHDVGGVDAVVGRDTVDAEKPDPAPLLEAIDRLDGDPARTLFVGDSPRDEEAARRAGTDYVDVSAWLRAYQ